MSVIFDIEEIVARAIETKASDIHLTEGQPPSYRRNGTLETDQNDVPIRREWLMGIMDEKQRQAVSGGCDSDFALALVGGRQRVNIYHERGRLVAAIRLLNETIPSMEQLRLPPALQAMAAESRGLVLVTGPTGSGKSTTLASMIQYIANLRPAHIITIEDPIEYVYKPSKSLIHQREVGRDVKSFEAALRSALREDPDVILLGEMRDYETISAAVTAAETGHLVLSTLHTTGAAKTVDRIIDVFPPYAQGQIRSQLAGVLKGVVTQQLLPMTPDPLTKKPRGRIAATEVMIGTDAILNLIRESKAHQINSVIQSSASSGMMTMDSCLANYVKNGFITPDVARQYAMKPEELRQFLR